MADEARSLKAVIDGLHQKHSMYADKIQSYIQNQPADEAEIKHISGQ